MANAAQRYCEAYDRYQTIYALHRLGGWNGDINNAPPGLRKAHTDMTDALGDFYEETMGRRRPNYVQVAKDMADDLYPDGPLDPVTEGQTDG